MVPLTQVTAPFPNSFDSAASCVLCPVRRNPLLYSACQWAEHPSKVPLSMWDLHPACFGHQSLHNIQRQHIDRFCRFVEHASVNNKQTHTNHATLSVTRSHLVSAVVQPNNVTLSGNRSYIVQLPAVINVYIKYEYVASHVVLKCNVQLNYISLLMQLMFGNWNSLSNCCRYRLCLPIWNPCRQVLNSVLLKRLLLRQPSDRAILWWPEFSRIKGGVFIVSIFLCP